MSYSRKASDWKVAPFAQVEGGSGIGGAILAFQFSSVSANISDTFIFVGGGQDVGGAANGVSPTPLNGTSIDSSRAFSLSELHGAGGGVFSIGASAIAGYSLISIAAVDRNGILFSPQIIHGPAVGVSLGEMLIVGGWASLILWGRNASKRIHHNI